MSKKIVKSFAIVSILLLMVLGYGFRNMENDGTTLHIFIIADTEDKTIGAIKDYPAMQAQVREIASMTHMNIQEYFYEKKGITGEFLKNKIQNLSCKPNDVIWFYYTGHGFNAEAGSGQFPGFELDGTNFAQERVHQKLSQKGARLVITMYDCCNWHGKRPQHTGRKILLDAPLRENYFALFREAVGDVKVASNTAGFQKYSYGNPDHGGLFSETFRQVLDSQLKGSYEDCTWERLLSKTRRITSKRAANLESPREQTPYYELNITRMKTK